MTESSGRMFMLIMLAWLKLWETTLKTLFLRFSDILYTGRRSDQIIHHLPSPASPRQILLANSFTLMWVQAHSVDTWCSINLRSAWCPMLSTLAKWGILIHFSCLHAYRCISLNTHRSTKIFHSDFNRLYASFSEKIYATVLQI